MKKGRKEGRKEYGMKEGKKRKRKKRKERKERSSQRKKASKYYIPIIMSDLSFSLAYLHWLPWIVGYKL